ncbi:hypothetical protein ALC60_12999 [Trachymyrmex zeteki]|uniref:DUF4817 domain-containing protein n=1 Tax=Mycetomoellerius zeteki TaxID=64791 RepID=A0A151WJJ5_9HYME|nr:hypothetical protein ALC60_12999 [Trachymyrmex zeteki]
MPRTYSNSEYADMVFVYGFCNGNALKAVREYARRFPNRRVPNRRVFMLTFNRLRETGTFSIRQENNRFQAALRRDLQAGNRILQHFDNHPETCETKQKGAYVYRTFFLSFLLLYTLPKFCHLIWKHPVYIYLLFLTMCNNSDYESRLQL